MAARPALEAELVERLMTHRVVLLHAAAGFGKSLLLARAVERLPSTSARVRLSLGEGDTLRGVCECLATALEPFDPPWRADPMSLAGAGEAHATAASFANTLPALDTQRGVLVLDDLHRAEGRGLDPLSFRGAGRKVDAGLGASPSRRATRHRSRSGALPRKASRRSGVSRRSRCHKVRPSSRARRLRRLPPSRCGSAPRAGPPVCASRAFQGECAHARQSLVNNSQFNGRTLVCTAQGWAYDGRNGEGLRPTVCRLQEDRLRRGDGVYEIDLDG